MNAAFQINQQTKLSKSVPFFARLGGEMKALLFVLALAALAHAGNVYVADYEYQADLNVFVVDYEYQADLCVYVVQYEYQAADDDSLWYFCDYEYQGDVSVYFCDYEYQADLCIFYVDYEYQAGWTQGNPWQERLH